MAPIIVNVNKDNILFNEEVFGPIMPVCKFKDVSEAVEIAN